MIAMPNWHLVLHKETLKQHFEKQITSIKHLIKIINLGAINCPVGRNGFSKKSKILINGCTVHTAQLLHLLDPLPLFGKLEAGRTVFRDDWQLLALGELPQLALAYVGKRPRKWAAHLSRMHSRNIWDGQENFASPVTIHETVLTNYLHLDCLRCHSDKSQYRHINLEWTRIEWG